MKHEKTEYQKEEIAKAEALANDLQKTLGEEATVSVSEKWEGTYFEGVEVYISYRGHSFRANRDYKGKYNFYIPLTLENSKNVSSHFRGKVYEKYKGKNIFTLSKDKVKNALEDEISTMLEIKEKMTLSALAIEEFKKTLKGEAVQWSNDEKSGEIEKSGVIFSFSFCDDGYISKKIELSYKVENTLESFRALADNKYTA